MTKCNYKTLEYNEHGYVMCCESCGQMRVAFGNISVKFKPGKYDEFREMIGDYVLLKKNELARDVKNIYIESPCRDVSLVFSANELENLNALMEEAALTAQVNQLLETD